MDPLEMVATIFSLRPTDLILADRDQCIAHFAESVASDDMGLMAADSFLASCVHRELVVRGYFPEALDFFSRVNAIHPVIPPEMSYTEYVDSLLA
jgi:hypothetical protein